ncbi:MAG: VanZ family protein [Gemmataceae bacterium]
MTSPPKPFPAIWFWGLSAGLTLFTIYGSLVPFEYVPRPWSDACHSWAWVWGHRLVPESRSDFLANYQLGLPLGFCLLGALRLDRKGIGGTILAIALTLPFCVGLATAVEFTQLWFPKRTCAASDVIAQSLGSTSGMVIWIAVGQRMTDFARKIWLSPNVGGRIGRALVLYLICLAAVMTLPWDISASPADWVRKARQEITYRPFQEWQREEQRSKKLRDWAEQIALFAPVGLLAAGLPGRFRRASGVVVVGVSGLVLGLLIETAQWPIVSRHPSMTDVTIDTAAVLLGWITGRCLALRWIHVLAPALAWLGLLAGVEWWPMDFDHSLWSKRISGWELLPFLSLESKNYMFWLEEIIVKSMFFAPLGAAGYRLGLFRIVALCALASMAIEVGQIYLADRYPSLTDVILAVTGGGIGAIVTRAVLKPEENLPREISA